MPITWILNTVGLFATTVGALLIFLYLWRSPRFADQWLSPDGQRAYQKQRRLLTIAIGLIASWLVIQYVGVILL
ncbi:MAG: hypothetical protein AB1773_01485 [Pseudomonadota bacterium]